MEKDLIDYITHKRDTIIDALHRIHEPTKQGHNYLPIFHRHFADTRLSVKRVLEIGVQTNRSVNFWRDYFPNAEIWGLDIDPNCKQYESERINIVVGDQSDPKVLETLPKDFDIIIDDGSHIIEHQIGSFLHLYVNNMRETGIYVVEDCEGRLPTIQWFKQLVDLINFWPENFDASKWDLLDSLSPYTQEYFVLNTIGISFYRYLICVDKGRNPEHGEAAHRLTS